jgi:glucoamylase
MSRSLPAGAATPLCWSQAEYVSVVGSRHDGICSNRVDQAFQRHVVNPVKTPHEMWSARHSIRHMPPGQTLRLIVAADATIVWSAYDWTNTYKADATHVSALNVCFADLPTEDCADGSVIEFTFFWKEAERWEGRNYSVAVSGPK